LKTVRKYFCKISDRTLGTEIQNVTEYTTEPVETERRRSSLYMIPQERINRVHSTIMCAAPQEHLEGEGCEWFVTYLVS